MHDITTAINIRATPNFIPYECFHKGTWLLPVNNPGWYYFAQIPGANADKIPEYEIPEDNLKPIVDFLREKKIQITYSCQKHFCNKDKNFQAIYDSLLKDSECIKKEGLVFKNEETGEFYNFRKSDYQLPWTRNEFIKKASEYQKRGVIGIKDGDKQEELRKIEIPGVHVKTDDEFTIFITKANNERQVACIWENLLTALKRIYR
jgi:hypothetical protein